MDDDLTFKIVAALNKYDENPSPAHGGISIGKLSINIAGDVHVHGYPFKPDSTTATEAQTRKSRKEMINAIHLNAGRYFLKGQFSNVLDDLFGITDLQKASVAVLTKVLEWSEAWNHEVVTGTDD